MKNLNKFLCGLAATLFLSANIWAGDVTVPNTFTSGTPAVAADMNANFSAVKSAVDDNNARINTSAADISNNTVSINTNAADVSNNTTSINTNAADVSNNITSIDINAADIINNETRVSDIESRYITGKGDLSVVLTGLVTVTAGGVNVIGSGTLFTTELDVGDVISIAGENHVVASITNNAILSISDSHIAGASGASVFTDGDLLTLSDSAGREKLSVNRSGGIKAAGNALPINLVKMRFERIDNENIVFTEADGTVTTLNIPDPTIATGNSKIYYHPTGANGSPGGTGDSVLLFNISASTSISCTLLHMDDYVPRYPYSIATDDGNTVINTIAWGNDTTNTFMISHQGSANEIPVQFLTGFEILCF